MDGYILGCGNIITSQCCILTATVATVAVPSNVIVCNIGPGSLIVCISCDESYLNSCGHFILQNIIFSPLVVNRVTPKKPLVVVLIFNPKKWDHFVHYLIRFKIKIWSNGQFNIKSV